MLLDSGSDLSWLRSAEFEKLGGKVEWAGRLKIVYANGDEERIPTERKTICVTITHPELSKVIMRVQVYKQRAIKGQDYVLTIGRACMGANNVLYAPCEDGLIRSQALFRRKGRPGYAPEYLVGSETIRAMVRMVEKGESVKEWLIVSPPGFWRRRIPRVVSAGRRDCVRVDHDSCLRVNNDGYVRVDDDAVCICLTRPPERIQTPRKRRGI